HFSAPVVRGRRVVDVGSGEGYGAALLAAVAAEVVGIELDPRSVEHARLNHRRSNLEFVQGSVLDRAAYGERRFDVAVCFEVLEHLEEQDVLLGNIADALTDDGLLLISTPDREVYSAPGAPPNPYHVRELNPAEFDALLHAHFPHVAVWGQWTVSGARFEALTPPAPEAVTEAIDVGLRDDGWEVTRAPRPVYLLAAASRSPLPPLPGSWELRDHGLELAQVLRRQLGDALRRIAELEAQAAPPPAAAPPSAVDRLRGLGRRGADVIRRAARRASG
ncbi:MAG TPA: methyltransferase domain-containing protein, partial [Candidatus Dormibacteraeota bacterium]